MNRSNLLRLSSLVLLGAAVALPASPRTAVAESPKPLLVIMGASSPVKDISTSALRSAFLGEAALLPGGKRFIPINHPLSSPARVAFDQLVLGLSAEQVGAFWIDRRIRAESAPPRTVPSPELAARIVASLPGAITYATPELVSAQVKVLSVDGKAVGTASYPLGR